MGKRRRAPLLALTAVVAGVTAAGVTYACVPQPFISIQPSSSAAAGAQVTVDGQLFDENSRVEIRWNGPDGPMLATAASPDFSVPVAIPSSPPGLYTVMAVSRNPGGVRGSVARAEFLVTSETPAAREPVEPEASGDEGASGGGASFADVAAAVALLGVGALGGAWLTGRRRGRPVEGNVGAAGP